ncbi:MYND-type domain-containing protein [Mycena sanguinolenta]|uniref:MYND-type domain-containing protein n=1 Tax=Mycena sanguinolenta TaxID=230812 RepID=A0A8H7CJY4_9AGAR|nr:MYND-type domain-containing protein [Mycena sanguinolenta]
MDDPRAYYEPRAHLYGVNIPKDFSLPALSSVRADATRSREMRKRPKDYEDIAVMFPPGSPANKEPHPVHLKLALIFSEGLPSLFCFSYYAREDDVPEDIVDDCIWALSLHISIMEECSETVLRAAGYVKEHDKCELVKYYTLANARWKIVSHLLHCNRAEEAAPIAKTIVEVEYSHGDERWLQNPIPFFVYGKALVLTRSDDHEAARMLRRALLGLESGNRTVDHSHSASAILELVQTRTWLARALRNIGLDDEAKSHEQWLISWFRKNPHLMMDKDLRRLLLPAGPVLEGLGGETWFETRKKTTKTAERSVKACRTCRAREPLVTLSRCNNCKYIYYCSKECQRADWKHHKVLCREMVAEQEKVERLSLTDPVGAKRAADWSVWRKLPQFDTLVHALGLHRDPGRGKTHIVFRAVEYVPTATKIKHKFRVVSCGVFRIKDVLRDIELIMGLDHGEGQEYVDSLLHEPAAPYVRVPHIDLTFGDGIQAWLGNGE